MRVTSSIKTFLLLHLLTASPISVPTRPSSSPLFHFSKNLMAQSFSSTDQKPSDPNNRYLKQDLQSITLTSGCEITPILQAQERPRVRVMNMPGQDSFLTQIRSGPTCSPRQLLQGVMMPPLRRTLARSSKRAMVWSCVNWNGSTRSAFAKYFPSTALEFPTLKVYILRSVIRTMRAVVPLNWASSTWQCKMQELVFSSTFLTMVSMDKMEFSFLISSEYFCRSSQQDGWLLLKIDLAASAMTFPYSPCPSKMPNILHLLEIWSSNTTSWFSISSKFRRPILLSTTDCIELISMHESLLFCFGSSLKEVILIEGISEVILLLLLGRADSG